MCYKLTLSNIVHCCATICVTKKKRLIPGIDLAFHPDSPATLPTCYMRGLCRPIFFFGLQTQHYLNPSSTRGLWKSCLLLVQPSSQTVPGVFGCCRCSRETHAVWCEQTRNNSSGKISNIFESSHLNCHFTCNVYNPLGHHNPHKSPPLKFIDLLVSCFALPATSGSQIEKSFLFLKLARFRNRIVLETTTTRQQGPV